MSDEEESVDATRDRGKQPGKPAPTMHHIVSDVWAEGEAEGKDEREDADEEADARSGILDNMPRR